MDVRRCGRATYAIPFKIWALVGWVFCFRDCFRDFLRAYRIKPLSTRTPDKISGHNAMLTLRNTLPRGPPGAFWLSKHAAQEVLVEKSRK